jgi:hypothetical protein
MKLTMDGQSSQTANCAGVNIFEQGSFHIIRAKKKKDPQPAGECMNRFRYGPCEERET